jgi:hypothetical protein
MTKNMQNINLPQKHMPKNIKIRNFQKYVISNPKYDASYRNPENTTRLLGRALTLGQACGLIGVALFGADIPLEGAGDY